jgi:hypothetical protein
LAPPQTAATFRLAALTAPNQDFDLQVTDFGITRK